MQEQQEEPQLDLSKFTKEQRGKLEEYVEILSKKATSYEIAGKTVRSRNAWITYVQNLLITLVGSTGALMAIRSMFSGDVFTGISSSLGVILSIYSLTKETLGYDNKLENYFSTSARYSRLAQRIDFSLSDHTLNADDVINQFLREIEDIDREAFIL